MADALGAIEVPTVQASDAGDIRAALAARRAQSAGQAPPRASAAVPPAPAAAAAPSSAAPAAPLSAPIEGEPARRSKKSGAQRRKEQRDGRPAGRVLTPGELANAKRTRGAHEAAGAAADQEAREKAAQRAATAAQLATPEGRKAAAAGIGGTLGLLFDIIATRGGAHWRLQPDERAALGEGAVDAFGASLPLLIEHGAKFAFAGALYTVVSQRVEESERIATKAPAAPAAPATGGAVAVTTAEPRAFIGDIA